MNRQSTLRILSKALRAFTFTHDGQTYVMKAPVTIEVDSTFPLTESILTTDIAARVGVFAVEILSVSEPEELEIGYTTIEPSEDGNKLVSCILPSDQFG